MFQIALTMTSGCCEQRTAVFLVTGLQQVLSQSTLSSISRCPSSNGSIRQARAGAGFWCYGDKLNHEAVGVLRVARGKTKTARCARYL